jgi:hypothetical protein
LRRRASSGPKEYVKNQIIALFEYSTAVESCSVNPGWIGTGAPVCPTVPGLEIRKILRSAWLRQAGPTRCHFSCGTPAYCQTAPAGFFFEPAYSTSKTSSHDFGMLVLRAFSWRLDSSACGHRFGRGSAAASLPTRRMDRSRGRRWRDALKDRGVIYAVRHGLLHCTGVHGVLT